MPIGTQVASLFGVLSLDDSDFQRGLKDADKGMSSVSDKVKNFGQNLTSLGGNMTAFGAPFAAIAAVAANAWDNWDDAMDQTRAVLQSTGGAAGMTLNDISDLGDELQRQTGIIKTNIVGGENMLLTFTNIGHSVFPRATKAALDLSVAMKQDMKSSVQQLGKALNDPINMLSSLTRVGVTFTDQQTDMIKTMQEAGDVAGAQGIVLAEIEREFGGSAAALADPIDHLKASVNDLAIDVGSAFTDSLNGIIEVAMPFIESLTEWVDENHQLVGTILLIGGALAVIGPILAVIGTGLTAIGGLFAVVFSPIGLIVAAVAGLFLAIQNNFLGIRDFLQPVIDTISNFFAHFSDNVKLYGSLIALYAQYYFQQVVTAVQNVIDEVKAWMAQNPELLTMFTVIGIAVGVLIGIMVGLPLLISGITAAVGLLTAGLAILFSPVVLITAAIAGLLYLLDKTYPGGLKKMFHDAAVSAQELATILQGVATNAINSAANALANLMAIGAGIANGSFTPQQVLNAVGGQISGGAGQGGATGANAYSNLAGQIGLPPPPVLQPIPPVGGGSSLPLPNQVGFGGQGISANNSVNIEGGVHINANSYSEGYNAMDGVLARARARGAVG